MGVFDDKKFEGLDWISQATEPIDSELNEILRVLPDETIIDFDLMKKMLRDSYHMDLSLDRAVSYLISHNTQKYLSWKQKEILLECFKFEMNGEEVHLDFEKRVITGEIKLIKLTSTLDEKVLERSLGSEGLDAVAHMIILRDGLSRCNEVMEILGKCQEGLRTKSDRRKRAAIHARLKEIFKTNEWKIKDTELANKVGTWIQAYVSDGNLAAYSNFCRLKVMTHRDQPIYSMEEAK